MKYHLHLCLILVLVVLEGCATSADNFWSDIQMDTVFDTSVSDLADDGDPAMDIPVDALVDTMDDAPIDLPADPALDTVIDTGWDSDVVDTAIDPSFDTIWDSEVVDTTFDTIWDSEVLDSPVDTTIDDGTMDPDVTDTVADTAVDTLPDATGCTVFGTDSFGYTGCSSMPGISGCDDIRTSGALLTTGDDEYSRAPMGFTFSFYGTSYTDVSVGTNGHVYFTDAYLGLGNVCLPGDPGYSSIVTFIAGYWTDLDSIIEPSNGIWYQTLGSAPDRRLVVQWDTGYCCSSYGGSVEFTIVLFETSNDIRVCYGNTTVGYSSEDLGAGATAGIQRDLTNSLQFSCNAPNLVAGLQLDYLHP